MYNTFLSKFRFIAAPGRRIFNPRLKYLLFFFIIISTPLHAQRYQVDTYTEADGLSSSSVKSIAQDSLGHMWFATRSGISTYDGYSWKTYGLEDGLATLNIRFILIDDRNRVWVASSKDGITVSMLDSSRVWKTIPHIEGPLGRKGVTSAEVIRAGDKTVLAAVIGEEILCAWDESSWTICEIPESYGNLEINGLEKAGGRLFAATSLGVLEIYAADGGLRLREFSQVPSIWTESLAYDQENDLYWVTGRDWIGRVKEGNYEIVADRIDFDFLGILDWMICEPDGMGGLFAGNGLKLLHYSREGNIYEFTSRNGLIDEGAFAIFRDHEGNIWTAGDRGVSKIISLRWANYSKEHGLFNHEVTAIQKLPSGDKLLGHYDGLTFFGDTIRTLEFRRKQIGARVLDLALGHSGDIWIAASEIGLGRMESGGSIEWLSEYEGLNRSTQSVLAGREGRIWIASEGEIFVRENGSFRSIPIIPGLEGGNIRRLFEGRDGSIYGATVSKGLVRIRGGEVTRWNIGNTPNENNIFSMFEREDGTIWIGTYGGLFIGSEGNFNKSVSPGPEISRPVYIILKDRKGRLWFGTDNGVLRWDGSEVVSFTVENGFIGREVNRDAGLVDSDGKVWIGTDNGLSIYCEEYDRKEVAPPRVELLSLEAGERSFPLDTGLKLDYNSNELVFNFNAVSYVDQKNVRFRSRLEGFEDEWSKPYLSAEREIRYTNLPPGEYIFHLQASLQDDAWSRIASSGPILIERPFWASWWFRGTLLLAAGLLIYFFITYILEKRYSRQLEHEVREKVAEKQLMEKEIAKAEQLKSIGILAGGIAHDFNNLLTAIIGNLSLLELSTNLDQKERNLVDRAMLAAERSTSLAGQLMTFSRGGDPIRQPGSIANVIRESASFILSGSNVRCEYSLPDNIHTVKMDAGQISQVISNIIINAQEAMPEGGRIWITARNFENRPGEDFVASLDEGIYVRVEIEDEGSGIPDKDINHIFDPYFTTKESGSGLGLTTAYSILNKHDGLLTAESKEGNGSRFIFYLPRAEEAEHEPEDIFAPELPSGGRLLVMDDEPLIISTISRMLSRFGFDVTTASEGEEAVRLFREAFGRGERFDVVILDLTVPGGMGGKETVKRMVEIDPEVKAIVSSGYSNDDVMSNHSAYGFCACICKPFTPEELKAALASAFEARDLYPER